MTERTCTERRLRHQGPRWLAALMAMLLVVVGCRRTPDDAAPPPAAPAPSDSPAPPAEPVPAPPPDPAVSPSSSPSSTPAPSAAPAIGPVPAESASARTSTADTPREYRKHGATHLYSLNADRIYKGRLPPLLYAIGVINVEIDGAGRVTRLDWMRAPSHAPEVMAEIESTIRKAAPFPAPARLGKVVYTDTWLWHKSGKFQLDTLTEGQD